MSRLIDADKLMQEIKKMIHPMSTPDGSGMYDMEINAYDEAIVDVMRTIDEHLIVNDWIPVSENGYPKEKGWYQCTCDDRKVGEHIWTNHAIVRDLFWSPNMNEFVDNIRYSENLHQDIEKYFWTKYVTAWQPLPDPYQPEGGKP